MSTSMRNYVLAAIILALPVSYFMVAAQEEEKPAIEPSQQPMVSIASPAPSAAPAPTQLPAPEYATVQQGVISQSGGTTLPQGQSERSYEIVTPPPQNIQPAGGVDSQDAERIKRLLIRAENAYWELQLTTPEDDNAFDYYRQVLRIDSTNVAAQVGIQRIVKKYIELAEQSLTSGNLNRAESYVDKALIVDPSSIEAEELSEQIAKKQKARRAGPRYSSITSAKRAYDTGQIDKFEYKRIVAQLKADRDAAIRRAKERYRSGQIDKYAYKMEVRKIKARYN